jgi:hypothetical protein
MMLLSPFSVERMIRAVERVRERLIRSTKALENAGVDYAVVGGNAVASWVARVDESAVRNTQDVDILIARNNLNRASDAMAGAGFIYRQVLGIDLFLDGPDAKPRHAVHLLYAGEKVRPDYPVPSPELTDSIQTPEYRVLALEPLVQMKLTSYRLKDRVHILDLIGVGLIDESWPTRFPPPLGARLQELIDNPES